MNASHTPAIHTPDEWDSIPALEARLLRTGGHNRAARIMARIEHLRAIEERAAAGVGMDDHIHATIEAGMSGYWIGRPIPGGLTWRDTFRVLRDSDRVQGGA